jgi:hypothetical protein
MTNIPARSHARSMLTIIFYSVYRQANRVEELGLLIAQSQLIGDALSKSESVFYEKKTLVQASKFHLLLDVLFSDDYFDDVIIMNHTKHKDELDKGKAVRSEHL